MPFAVPVLLLAQLTTLLTPAQQVVFGHVTPTSGALVAFLVVVEHERTNVVPSKPATTALAKRARPPPLSPAPSIVMAAPVSVGKGETVSGNRHHLKLGAAQTRV